MSARHRRAQLRATNLTGFAWAPAEHNAAVSRRKDQYRRGREIARLEHMFRGIVSDARKTAETKAALKPYAITPIIAPETMTANERAQMIRYGYIRFPSPGSARAREANTDTLLVAAAIDATLREDEAGIFA